MKTYIVWDLSGQEVGKVHCAPDELWQYLAELALDKGVRLKEMQYEEA